MKVLIPVLFFLILVSAFLVFKEKYDDEFEKDCKKCRECMEKHPGVGTINLQSYGCYDVDTCSMCGTPEDIQGNIVNAIYTK
jgi:hypothetical protein